MIYDLLQFCLGPRLVSNLGIILTSAMAKTAVVCMLGGNAILFFWEAAYLFGLVSGAPSCAKPALSPFWRIAVLVVLASCVYVRIVASQ